MLDIQNQAYTDFLDYILIASVMTYGTTCFPSFEDLSYHVSTRTTADVPTRNNEIWWSSSRGTNPYN